eukprot:snap_masked-scaffold_1-processed-gene-7.4-mRNA-1 protein AED:1.00 eAED:1.00 QI:0/0/0/0/1/1/2/0/76
MKIIIEKVSSPTMAALFSLLEMLLLRFYCKWNTFMVLDRVMTIAIEMCLSYVYRHQAYCDLTADGTWFARYGRLKS